MNPFQWALLAWIGLGALLLVVQIGRPRPTYGTAHAVFGLIEFGAVAYMVVHAA